MPFVAFERNRKGGKEGEARSGFVMVLRSTYAKTARADAQTRLGARRPNDGRKNGRSEPRARLIMRTPVVGMASFSLGPSWSVIPTIQFIQNGVQQTHDINQYVSDPNTPDANLIITKNAIAFHASSGITYDQANHRLVYDGNGSTGGTNGHVFTADDASVNLPPVWVANANQTATVGLFFSVDLDTLCSDPELQPLTYTLVSSSLPAWLVQSGARGNILSGTPPSGATSFNFTMRATD